MKKPLITIIGNMGSGKTTLAKLIVEHLGFVHPEENFVGNVFLPKFYDDMRRWAFHSQAFYLIEKAKQLLSVNKMLKKKSIVMEPDILCDVEAYAKAQFYYKNMDLHEYRLYQRIYKLLAPHLPKPDLTIYLSTSILVLMERIGKRRREFEREVPKKYLEILNKLNDRLAKKLKALVIDTDNINIVNRKDHIEEVLLLIKQKMG